MIIIGEKINSTVKAVGAAINARDTSAIAELAKNQAAAGATYIDVNAGMLAEDEPEKLEWLVSTVQEAVDAPLSIDSPNPAAIERALKAARKGKTIINSVTYERERLDRLIPLALQFDAGVIALCMDCSGMPETAEDRLSIADKLVDGLTKHGVKYSDIFIDPMVCPVGTRPLYGVTALETIRRLREEFPGIHITCGLSNISYGIPARKLMNQAFLVAAMASGLDSAILDPLDRRLMSLVIASEALLGRDEYCMNYLLKYKEGLLET